MKISQQLTQAMKVIEKGWCKGTYAKNAKGQPVSPRSREAVRFLNYIDRHVPNFNDTQEEIGPVLQLFDDAIELAEREAALTQD